MKEQKDLIVEIGCGGQPFLEVGRRKIKPNETYLGLDLGHDQSFLRAKQVTKNLPNAHILRASATCIPLPDNSARKIVMCNVLGMPDGTYLTRQMIPEIKRVIEKMGR